MSQDSLSVRSCVCWMSELTKIDERLTVYFSAVALIQVAWKISKNSFSDELKNILSTILKRNSDQCNIVLSRSESELNTSEMVELLQKSAVEHLTIYRQLEAQDFGSVVRIATTDFEALYAYKRGDYQQCLQLCTQNVHTLLYAIRTPDIYATPEFNQLMDNEIVSLTLIVNPEHRATHARYVCISQLTLSLYLMTHCQLKLYHSVTSLAQTLHYIKVAQSRIPRDRTLDHLTLKLIKCKFSKQ